MFLFGELVSISSPVGSVHDTGKLKGCYAPRIQNYTLINDFFLKQIGLLVINHMFWGYPLVSFMGVNLSH